MHKSLVMRLRHYNNLYAIQYPSLKFTCTCNVAGLALKLRLIHVNQFPLLSTIDVIHLIKSSRLSPLNFQGRFKSSYNNCACREGAGDEARHYNNVLLCILLRLSMLFLQDFFHNPPSYQAKVRLSWGVEVSGS